MTATVCAARWTVAVMPARTGCHWSVRPVTPNFRVLKSQPMARALAPPNRPVAMIGWLHRSTKLIAFARRG